MDFKRFFRLIKRNAWVLILVPILAIVSTYFFSKNLPKEYKSEVQISTGLVDQSKQIPSDNQVDFFKIGQQFNNIIEQMKMRKIMSILSYNLIIHDLSDRNKAFRKYSKNLDSLSSAQINEVLSLYKDRLARKVPITVYDNAGKFKLYDLIGSMGYDESSVNKKLFIFRPDGSDFINIEFFCENPDLSAFLVNTLATEFINNYSVDVYRNQNTSIALLDSLLKNKEVEMNKKNAALKDFKMKNGVLNLDAQSERVYSQISIYEEKKAQAIQDIQANKGALSAINLKLTGNPGTNFGAGISADNSVIINLKNQLKLANDKYIDGNFRSVDKKRIDSLQRLLSTQSIRTSDKNAVDPLVSKQALIQQKLNLEISIEQIRNTISSIDKELASLRGQYSKMVPFDAGIQNFERDAEIATKDYLSALDKINQGKTVQNTGLKLQIAQEGLPSPPLPSKTIIYVALSGIASFGICFAFLLLSFISDRAIYSSAQLSRITGIPVLGALNFIGDENIDPRGIWKMEDANKQNKFYKDLLRSLRFEINKIMMADGSQILGITSLNSEEGKSFLSSCLVYALAMTGKRVLLITDNHTGDEREISQKLIPSEFFETFVVKKEFQTEDLITVFNNKFQDSSLLEIQSMGNIRTGFDTLKKEFDIIVIDITSLKEINKAKEWLSFTDKSIAVFKYGNHLKDEDNEKLKYIKTIVGFSGWVLNKVKLEPKGKI